MQVLDLLRRGEAGATAAIRVGLKPALIGIECRVPLGDSEGPRPAFRLRRWRAARLRRAEPRSRGRLSWTVSSKVVAI